MYNKKPYYSNFKRSNNGAKNTTNTNTASTQVSNNNTNYTTPKSNRDVLEGILKNLEEINKNLSILNKRLNTKHNDKYYSITDLILTAILSNIGDPSVFLDRNNTSSLKESDTGQVINIEEIDDDEEIEYVNPRPYKTEDDYKTIIKRV